MGSIGIVYRSMHTYIHHGIPRQLHGSNHQPQQTAAWQYGGDIDNDEEHCDGTCALPHRGTIWMRS